LVAVFYTLDGMFSVTVCLLGSYVKFKLENNFHLDLIICRLKMYLVILFHS